jgi:23S rRNA pseudouridine2605 synthase
MEDMEERLQKIMAQAGLGSRRDCEEFILAGRVRVNGTVAVIGQKADPVADKISLDMRLIKPAEQKVYIALHKPKYVLSTVDAEQGDSRQTVRDLVAVSERLYPVGRLDFESEGLVLMTNDGELAQKLTHPSHGHSKEYRVLLARQPDAEQIATWQRGVVLEDGYKTQRADVRTESLSGKGAWLRIVMREGRKRQIREIGAMLALPVVRIVRVRIGSLLLGGLKPSEWRYLTPEEIKALKEDRPGLAPFPDMTRKSPLKTRSKMVRRVPGRTGQAVEREKAPGRTGPTGPPGSREKAPGRTGPTGPPGSREKAPGRTGPPGSREKAPGRTGPPGSREKAPGRTGPPTSREKAPGRTRPPGGTAPDRSRSSGATGRPGERHEHPKGVRRPPVRKPK